MQQSLDSFFVRPLILLAIMTVFGAWNHCHAQATNSREAKSQPSGAAKIPAVSYCDLVSRPTRYNRKVVRITATYFVGMEAAALEDFRCDEDRSIWVDYDKSYVSCTKKEVKGGLDKELGPSEIKTENSYGIVGARRARVTFVGRFEVARKFIWKNRDRVFNNGFGHANQYPYRLVVRCLKQVLSAN